MKNIVKKIIKSVLDQVKNIVKKSFEINLGQLIILILISIIFRNLYEVEKGKFLFGKIDKERLILLIIIMYVIFFSMLNVFIYELRGLVYSIFDEIKIQILKKCKGNSAARYIANTISIENSISRVLYMFQVMNFDCYKKNKPIKAVVRTFGNLRKIIIFSIQTIVILFYLNKSEILEYINKINFNFYTHNIKKNVCIALENLKEYWSVIITLLLIVLVILQVLKSNRYERVMLESQCKDLKDVVDVNRQLQIHLRKIAIYMNEMLKDTFRYCQNPAVVCEEIATEFGEIEYNYSMEAFQARTHIVPNLNIFGSIDCEKREAEFCMCVYKIKQILDDFYKNEPFYGISAIKIIDKKIEIGYIYSFFSSANRIEKRLLDVTSYKNIKKIIDKQIEYYKQICFVNDIDEKCKNANKCLENINRIICDQWIDDVYLLISITEYVNDIYKVFELKKRDYSSSESLIKILK